MRRVLLFILSLFLAFRLSASVWYSVNFDAKTTAAMTAGYAAQAATEFLNSEEVKKILDHYSSAEVATAGIFASKWLDRKAMTNVGWFSDAENHYYRRIYQMVSAKIMPKILDVAYLLIKYPEKALYWGPYLFRVCEQTKQLCMIFETVVANGKLTFQEIPFLAINEDLRGLFDLAKLGNVDWSAVWDQLSTFGSDLSRDDFKEDLTSLMSAGRSIASAGGAILDSVWVNASKVGEIFHSKPREIIALYDEFKDMYETYSDPTNIKDLLMAQIISTDSTGVANLFTLDGYNITSYVSDFINEMSGRYYRQRWYIYWRNRGSEVVCDYSPPIGRRDIEYGREWYRYTSSNPRYRPSRIVLEAALSNSENYAGWSREKCSDLQRANRDYLYEFSPTLQSAMVSDLGSGPYVFAYAYKIKVTKKWDIREIVYEEEFDSQTMAESVMQARFESLLASYNSDGTGRTYYIGKDSKRYYNAPDANRMHGCSVASFIVDCNDSTLLGEGSFSWKENHKHRHGLNEESQRFAMESTLPSTPETQTLDQNISSLEEQIQSIKNSISTLERTNDRLLEQIGNSSIEDAEPLRAQYNENLARIRELQSQLPSLESQLAEYTSERDELMEDYDDEMDDTYRIPAVMHELETTFGLVWADAGHWEGMTFVRECHMPGIDGVITFRAELNMERSEKYFLGIRIHRAVLSVKWQLMANYASSGVYDVLELDPDLDDTEKARIVNDRMQEIMNENPSCHVEVEYAYSEVPDTDDDEDALHLLWVSDRLEIARDVDYRLSKIYAQLILIEKFMRSRESMLDFIKRAIGLTTINQAGKFRIGGKSYQRWRRSASGAVSSDTITETIAEILADTTLQKRY